VHRLPIVPAEARRCCVRPCERVALRVDADERLRSGWCADRGAAVLHVLGVAAAKAVQAEEQRAGAATAARTKQYALRLTHTATPEALCRSCGAPSAFSTRTPSAIAMHRYKDTYGNLNKYWRSTRQSNGS